MPRYDGGVKRIVTLTTAIVVTAATEDEAKLSPHNASSMAR